MLDAPSAEPRRLRELLDDEPDATGDGKHKGKGNDS
jgi:hypothetical protein